MRKFSLSAQKGSAELVGILPGHHQGVVGRGRECVTGGFEI